MPETPTLVVIRLFVLIVGSSVLVSLVTRRTAVPYTVGLVAFGLVVGTLLGTPEVQVTPELVLAVLLPGLIFEAAYQTDFGQLRSTMLAIAILAVPGVLAVAFLVAITLNVATGLDPAVGFVVGAMISATDPAAVIAGFKRLGAPRRLATLVEAESVFNDGTGIVLFAIAVDAVTQPIDVGSGLVRFVVAIVASSLLGGLAGYLASRIILHVDDHLIELGVSLVVAYGTYLLADAFHQSGVIATAVAALVLGNYGRAIGMSQRTIEAVDTVWEFLAFLLTASVFLLVGQAIRIVDLVHSIGYIACAIAAVLVGRAVIVYGVIGGLRRVTGAGRGLAIESGWLHVVFWSGLRGAVSVALALSLPIDFPQRSLVQEVTFGVVLFTLAVQATTADALLHRLGLVVAPGADERQAGSRRRAASALGTESGVETAVEPEG